MWTAIFPSSSPESTTWPSRRASRNDSYVPAASTRDARIRSRRRILFRSSRVAKGEPELFKQFVDNTDFKRWLGDTVFRLAYAQAGSAPEPETP